MNPQQAFAILATADLLYSAEELALAIGRVGREISAVLRDAHPVLICVMNGGVPFAGQLMTQLTFPLDFDFVQVSRYGQATSGGEIEWRVGPALPLTGRTVLIVDDILDEGVTLAAIRARLLELGAARCYAAVVADKMNGRAKPLHADFVAVTVPDRFLFGYGMDIRGAWRNLPAIYALREG